LAIEPHPDEDIVARYGLLLRHLGRTADAGIFGEQTGVPRLKRRWSPQYVEFVTTNKPSNKVLEEPRLQSSRSPSCGLVIGFRYLADNNPRAAQACFEQVAEIPQFDPLIRQFARARWKELGVAAN
jgi:hypothetical protein